MTTWTTLLSSETRYVRVRIIPTCPAIVTPIVWNCGIVINTESFSPVSNLHFHPTIPSYTSMRPTWITVLLAWLDQRCAGSGSAQIRLQWCVRGVYSLAGGGLDMIMNKLSPFLFAPGLSNLHADASETSYTWGQSCQYPDRPTDITHKLFCNTACIDIAVDKGEV